MNPFDPGYYSEAELADAGFRSLGRNVRIARNCTILGLENISIGDNVRIDGYCTFVANGDGWLRIGSYIHVGGYCLLSAGSGIELKDFSGLSQGVRLYSRSDDYSGVHLTNPTIPPEFTGVHEGTVTLGRHVILGSGTIVMPGVEVGEGSAVGANSLLNKSLDPWGIYFGSPAKRVKSRTKNLLELEKSLLGGSPSVNASRDNT